MIPLPDEPFRYYLLSPASAPCLAALGAELEFDAPPIPPPRERASTSSVRARASSRNDPPVTVPGRSCVYCHAMVAGTLA